MSKEVTVTAYCGNPHHEERVVATVEHTVALNGRQPRVIDMCSDCDANYTDLLVEFIEDGTPVTAPKLKVTNGSGRKPAAPNIPDTECPECHETNFTSRHTRNQHLRTVHGKSIREYA